MDQTTRLNQYRQILQQVVEKHAAMLTEPAEPESIAICDPIHDNYLLIDVGWENSRRVYYVVFHLCLKNGKVWIKNDGIEYGIARDLIEAGIPEKDIYLAIGKGEPRPLHELVAA